ncbi:hypothetical protein EC973_001265 [Apophysomyces ossiformis]|uniref:Uncharacterized protein n=1 Tax=Apophysomyces ossiformis TaxID=679940 RepID=A0A8H7BJR2_9FUNG|nr:hypothetical protein EC973_001265 [Apophysomyces ossiformis]
MRDVSKKGKGKEKSSASTSRGRKRKRKRQKRSSQATSSAKAKITEGYMPQMLSVVRSLFEKNSIPVCGVDPGIRTTGVSTSTTSAWRIQRIRDFTSNITTELQHDIYYTWSLQASAVNHHSRSNRHRLRRERAKTAEKEGTEAENRRIEREKRTREVFTQKAYHKYADVERIHFPPDMISQKAVHFYGHWQPTNSRIRGHARRGLKWLCEVQRRRGLVVIMNHYKY